MALKISATKRLFVLTFTLFTVVPIFAQAGLTTVELFNRRRTEMTLILYAPVLAEMLNQGEQETQSWFTKARAKFDSSFVPAQIFAERKQCLSVLLEQWQQRAGSGKFGSTRELLENVFQSQKQQSSACAAWLPQIAGKEAQGETHGSFLNSLMLAEEKFQIFDQKKAHLEALNVLTTTSGSRYFQAAQDIAFFYMDDQDKVIVGLARDWVRRLPKVKTFRENLDYVRPDAIVTGIAALGTVRLFGVLGKLSPGAIATPTQMKAATVSVGVHLGMLKAAAGGNKDGISLKKRFAVEGKPYGLKNASSNLDDWMPSIQNDVLPDSLLKLIAMKARRNYTGFFHETDFDMIGFLFSVQSQSPGQDPLAVEQQIADMRALSKQVGDVLAKNTYGSGYPLPPEYMIEQARQLIFKSNFVKSYVALQPAIVPYVGGQGGNCVAQTQLFLALLYPHRHLLPQGWELAMEQRPLHSQAVVLNRSKEVSIDLMTGRRAKGLRHMFYQPLAFVEGYARFIAKTSDRSGVKASDWKPYVTSTPKERAKEARDLFKDNSEYSGMAKTRFDLPPNLEGPADKEIPMDATIEYRAIEDEIPGSSPYTPASASSSASLSRGGPTKLTLYSPRDYPAARKQKGWDPKNLPIFEVIDKGVVGGFVEESEIIFKNDFDRDDYARQTSIASRVEFLEFLLKEEISDRREEVKAATNLVTAPRTLAPKLEETGLATRIFTADDLVSRFLMVESIRTQKLMVQFNSAAFLFEDRLLETERKVLANPYLRDLLQAQMKLARATSDSPEVVAKILDDPKVPEMNKRLLMSLVTQRAVPLLPQARAMIQPAVLSTMLYQHHLLGSEPFNKMLDAVSDARRIGIAQKANEIPLNEAAPSLKVNDNVPGLMLKLKDRKDSVTGEEPCPVSDPTGRCRRQNVVYVSDIRATSNVSLETFMAMYFNFARSLETFDSAGQQASLALRTQIAARWTPDLELAYLNEMITAYRQPAEVNLRTAGFMKKWSYYPPDLFILLIENAAPMLIQSPAKAVGVDIVRGVQNVKTGAYDERKVKFRTTPILAAIARCGDSVDAIGDDLTKRKIKFTTLRPYILKCLDAIAPTKPDEDGTEVFKSFIYKKWVPMILDQDIWMKKLKGSKSPMNEKKNEKMNELMNELMRSEKIHLESMQTK